MGIKEFFEAAFQLVKLPTVKILIVIFFLSNTLWIVVASIQSKKIDNKDQQYLSLLTDYKACQKDNVDRERWWTAKVDSVKDYLSGKYESLLIQNNNELRDARKEVKEAKKTMVKTINNIHKNK